MTIDIKKTGIAMAWILSLAAILPFVVLFNFNHPLGVHEWDWITNWGGRWAGESFWAQQRHWYLTTMGRYSSTALMSLTDEWYTLGRFQALFALFYLLWGYGLYLLLRTTLRLSLKSTITILLGLLLAYLHQLSGPYDTIYRYTSVLTYQTGLLALFIWLAALYRAFTTRTSLIFQWLVLPLLAIFAVGTNEITLVTINLVWGTVLLVSRPPNIPLWFWILGFIIIGASLTAVLAPGNYQRMEAYQNTVEPGGIFLLTAEVTAFLWTDWILDGLWLPLTLLWLPFAWRLADNGYRLFHHPAAWLGFIVLLIPIALFPLLWGTRGASLPERIVDMLYLTVLLGWLGACVALCRQWRGKWPNYAPVLKPPLIVLISLWAFGQVFFQGLQIDRTTGKKKSAWDLVEVDANIGRAWKVLLSGKAQKYDQEMQRQYAVLEQCKVPICQVPPPSDPPAFLYESLSDRRTKTGDPFMGKYFAPTIKKVVYQQPAAKRQK